jgi:hypothetical protein
MSLLSTLSWWITDGILLDNSTDSSFFLLTPLDDTPYRRMGMSYQVICLEHYALMTHQRQLSSQITLIQLTSVVDLDSRIQHKIMQSVWS